MAMLNNKNTAPTAQRGPQDGESGDRGEADWLKRAQDAYRDSTSYLDTNYRKAWDDSIRAFHNQHSSDSKYNHPSFEKRSRLYRPKLRSVIRKNEAAAAAAFFSNMDVVSIDPVDPGNRAEVASAQIMKELMQYRLTKSIPWFQTLIGGLQDAQTTGVACAHVHWEFEAEPQIEAAKAEVIPLGSAETDDEYPKQDSAQLPPGTEAVETPDQIALAAGGDPTEPPSQNEYKDDFSGEEAAVEVEAIATIKPRVDKPCVDLFPVENLRIDPGANWIDPINSSPFVIHLIPTYIMDVKSKMEKGEWRKLSDNLIRAAANAASDSTRGARGKDREDPYAPDGKSLPDYEIVWVQRHIHRRDGEDWEFYMLGDLALLTSPRPLKESVFHGMRPYVMGVCVLETHRIMPSSLPMLGKGLADEANEVANQRIDNVKFVLNKKWFAKRGQDVDVGGLVRNVPGGVVMMQDPVNDVREVTWPDVTASSYEEQQRIDADMNDLLGNFSAAQVMADRGLNSPARNMALLGQSAGTLVEYLLRTFVETFVQPVLRQLVMLEQKYESDQNVLAIVAKKAQLHQKFGIDKVTDELLEKELTLTVNVGMGATDPMMKLQKFLLAMGKYVEFMRQPPPGINLKEVGAEIFGHLGYSNGSRFFTNEDPQVAMMQAQIQQLNQVITQMKAKLDEKVSVQQLRKDIAVIQGQTKIADRKIHEEHNDLRNVTTHLRAIRESDQARQHEAVMHGIEKRLEIEHAAAKDARSAQQDASQAGSGTSPKPMELGQARGQLTLPKRVA